MKKVIQVICALIVVILILIFILPFALRGKIDDIIKEEGHKMVNAEFDFSKLDISIVRNFPNVTVTLEDFWIKGVDEFSNDTLVRADGLIAGINVFSVFNKEGLEITNIELNNSNFKAIVSPNGKANWDIMKVDTTLQSKSTIDEDKKGDNLKSSDDSGFRIHLNRFAIKKMNIVFQNLQENLYANINDFNLICSGNFSSDKTTVNLNGSASTVSIQSKGIPYLFDAAITAKAAIDADFSNQRYELKENEITINTITTSLDGWFKLSDLATAVDIRLATNQIEFKDILSLVPAIYTTDFEELKTDGLATISAYMKGDFIGDSIVPAMDIKMEVVDGKFKYASLPAAIDNINILAIINNPGGNIDQTSVTINPCKFRLGGNPFSLTAEVSTPVTDAEFAVTAHGIINLSMIEQVYPTEAFNLNGIIQSDLKISGLMSYIEKEQYDKIKASGQLSIKDMKLKTSDMPDVEIEKSLFTFSSQHLELSDTKIQIGNSDLSINSRLENYLGFLLKNNTLKGKLNLSSSFIDLNQFMTASADTVNVKDKSEEKKSETTKAEEPTLLLIPQNIDFEMNVNLKKLIMKDLSLNDINGKMNVKDACANMSNLSVQTMGGSIIVNGYYSTANINNPEFKSGIKINNLSFEQAYNDLELVKQMAPIFQNLTGHFSGSMDIETLLDAEMKPVLNTVQANGSLSTHNLKLSGVKVIDDIADALKQPNLKEMQVKDLSLDFKINDGRLITKPFDIKLGDYAINLSGSSGLDQTIDYVGKIKLPSSAGDLSKIGTVNLNIGGTFSSPKVSIDTQGMLKQAAESVGDKAMQEVGKHLGLDSTVIANTDSLKETIKEKAVEKAIDFLKKIK